jgi:hypothetical protein
MTCLDRHRGEVKLWLQPICNPAVEGGEWSAPLCVHFTPERDLVLTFSNLAVTLRTIRSNIQKF